MWMTLTRVSSAAIVLTMPKTNQTHKHGAEDVVMLNVNREKKWIDALTDAINFLKLGRKVCSDEALLVSLDGNCSVSRVCIFYL